MTQQIPQWVHILAWAAGIITFLLVWEVLELVGHGHRRHLQNVGHGRIGGFLICLVLSLAIASTAYDSVINWGVQIHQQQTKQEQLHTQQQTNPQEDKQTADIDKKIANQFDVRPQEGR